MTSPAAITRQLPNTGALTFPEFQNDPISQHHYTATCGEATASAAIVTATPQTETKQQAIDLMTSITRQMMANKWADTPNGNTTTAHLYQELTIERGMQIAAPYVEYNPSLDFDWLRTQMLAFAGLKPWILMLLNGQALKAVDGSHTEAGLQGHFICGVGVEPRGYICYDPDNSNIRNALPIYSRGAIQAARPSGFLMIEPQISAAPQIAELTRQLAAANADIASLRKLIESVKTALQAV